MQTEHPKEHGQGWISQFQDLPIPNLQDAAGLACTPDFLVWSAASACLWGPLKAGARAAPVTAGFWIHLSTLSEGTDGYTELQVYSSGISKKAICRFYERSVNS